MVTEQNEAVVRRYVEEAWNQGKADLLDEIMSSEYARYTSGSAQRLTRDGQKQRITTLREAFPDLHFTIDDLIAAGDTVVMRLTARGTHQGRFMGIAPTGKPVTVTGIDIARFADGKIVEHWGEMDTLVLLRQLAFSRCWVRHKHNGQCGMFINREGQVFTVKERYELGNTISSKVLAFGLSAEIERSLISARTKEGLARRKAEGKKLGRPAGSRSRSSKLAGKEADIERLLTAGVPQAAIARVVGVNRHTIAGYVKKHVGTGTNQEKN